MTNEYKNRNYEIDGIRGSAAISVLIFHFFWEAFSGIFPFLRTSLFSFIADGPLAVCVFFVLSGDALSVSFFSSRSTFTTIRLVLTRYFRLVLPIFASCLIVYFLMKSGLVFSQSASHVLQRKDWLGSFLPFSANYYSCFNYSFYHVFINHSTQTSYNPFLWTMSIEMVGSMIIFLNIFLIDYIKKPLLFLTIQTLFLLWLESWFCLFTLGMLFGHLRALGLFERLIAWRYSTVWTFFVLTGVILFDTIYRIPDEPTSFANSFILSGLLVCSIYGNRLLTALFQTKFFRFLGEISFPVYLLQFAVLISYTSWLTLKVQSEGLLYDQLALLIPVSSLLLTVLLAVPFRKLEKITLLSVNKIVLSWIKNPQ